MHDLLFMLMAIQLFFAENLKPRFPVTLCNISIGYCDNLKAELPALQEVYQIVRGGAAHSFKMVPTIGCLL